MESAYQILREGSLDTVIHPPERHVPVEGAFNVRDLGGYRTRQGGTTRWGAFLRADSLHALDTVASTRLSDTGLVAVVDLRTPEELDREPSPFASHERVRYHHVSLFGALDPIRLLEARQSGTFRMVDRYIEALDGCHVAIATVVERMANAEDGIVLFNCTAGKDRTGIIAALLLSLAGVGEDDIVADYALTARADGMLDRLRGRLTRAGYAPATVDAILASEPAAMQATLDHLRERHGGAEAYLLAAGLDKDALAAVRRRLVAA